MTITLDLPYRVMAGHYCGWSDFETSIVTIATQVEAESGQMLHRVQVQRLAYPQRAVSYERSQMLHFAQKRLVVQPNVRRFGDLQGEQRAHLRQVIEEALAESNALQIQTHQSLAVGDEVDQQFWTLNFAHHIKPANCGELVEESVRQLMVGAVHQNLIFDAVDSVFDRIVQQLEILQIERDERCIQTELLHDHLGGDVEVTVVQLLQLDVASVDLEVWSSWFASVAGYFASQVIQLRRIIESHLHSYQSQIAMCLEHRQQDVGLQVIASELLNAAEDRVAWIVAKRSQVQDAGGVPKDHPPYVHNAPVRLQTRRIERERLQVVV